MHATPQMPVAQAKHALEWHDRLSTSIVIGHVAFAGTFQSPQLWKPRMQAILLSTNLPLFPAVTPVLALRKLESCPSLRPCTEPALVLALSLNEC